MSSKSPQKGFVGQFRAGVNFSERLAKNLFKSSKWLIKTSRELHAWLLSLHPTRHEALPVVYGIVVGVVIVTIIIPVFAWAFLKAI